MSGWRRQRGEEEEGGARGGAHPLVAVWQSVVQGGGCPLHQDADGLPQKRHHAGGTGQGSKVR